jgi:hypothetical protein
VAGRSSGLLLDLSDLSRTEPSLSFMAASSLPSEKLLSPLRIFVVFVLCDFCLLPAVVGPHALSCKVAFSPREGS